MGLRMIGLYGTLSWQVNETYPDPFPGFSLTHTLMIKTLYLNYLNLLFYASQDPIDQAPGEKAHPKVGLVPETTRSINNKSPDRR